MLTTTRTIPENIMLSERSQLPKQNVLYKYLYIKLSGKTNLYIERVYQWLPRAWEEEEMRGKV
jgi:hypothetical protein